MKPNLNFICLHLKWAKGIIACGQCPFYDFEMWKEPCKSCVDTYADDVPYHPVIVDTIVQ